VRGKEKNDKAILMPTSPNLELLKVEGHYKHMNRDTGVATTRLLGSWQTMCVLRFRLNKHVVGLKI
jgi:hypothetical protein